jgi:hypothetical protein
VFTDDAQASGDVEKASRYFDHLITLTQNSDSDRSEVAEAKAFLSKNRTS